MIRIISLSLSLSDRERERDREHTQYHAKTRPVLLILKSVVEVAKSLKL